MVNNIKIKSMIFAMLAAIFYAINIPLSKVLLNEISSTMMASFLYLGAGIGIGILSIIDKRINKLDKNDLPFVVGMILLDIAAPIFLMLGIKYGTATSTSLLGNFEIVATSIIALIVFKELISKRLWIAIVLITISSIILSFVLFLLVLMTAVSLITALVIEAIKKIASEESIKSHLSLSRFCGDVYLLAMCLRSNSVNETCRNTRMSDIDLLLKKKIFSDMNNLVKNEIIFSILNLLLLQHFQI